ncbi:MAG: hypothetical protein AAFR74_02460 [Pseudomonadota bacterium]
MPVWLWPVVWWRLIWLRAHLRASGRGALYRIQPDGRIQVYLSPDETDGTAWLYQQSQLWRDHWTPMQDKSGEAHLGSIRYWTPLHGTRSPHEFHLTPHRLSCRPCD